MHQRGYVHGDLRASNILFNDEGTPILGGIAMSAFHTEVPEVMGPQAWWSPEMWQNRLLTALIDAWGIGCLLYYLVTGTVSTSLSHFISSSS
jgi:serine/threonine protein kinase